MDIRKVTCVGVGQIGQGWATLFASKGFEVILQDVSEEVLEAAVSGVASHLAFLEANVLLRQGEAKEALSRIKTTTSLIEAVDHVDYVQESVYESYELKKKIFNEMDAAAPKHTILASSASGLLMSEIQKAAARPERCVLAHPMLPVHLIPLVEVVGGEQTSHEAVTATYELMLRLGKAPVVLNKEVPGYIINRLQAAVLREAIDLVDEGIVSANDVDKAFCMGIGLRDPLIGPLLRIHLAGSGVERFLENYSQSYRFRWESMETWTSIPPSAAKKIINGVKEMEVVRTKTLEEINRWRDEKLIQILKVLHTE